MVSIKRDEHGIGHIESLLVVVIVAIIGFTGWYVYHTKQNSDKALNAAASTSNNAGPRFTKKATSSSPAASGSTSNASLQTDQQSAASSANQGSKDLSASNDSLNDKSTLTSVPQ